MNVAIIGSNGFIGSHLARKVSEIADVKLHLFGRGLTSEFDSSVPYTQLDLLNKEQIIEHFSNIDIVYYLVSGTIPVTSWEDPSIEIEKNLLPFIHFTESIAKLNVKKIVFVSSAGTIYGPSSKKVNEEADKQPFSPYGIIKLTIEHFLNYFKVKYNINFDIYRVSNVYGEGQNTAKGLGIINTFIENILFKKQIHIFGNGENLRNYVYVKDVAELMCYSIQSDVNTSGIYNVSSDDSVSINDLVKVIREVVTEDFEVIYEKGRQSDNSVIDLDNSKILSTVKNFKFTSLTKGVRETYAHLKEQFIAN